MRRWFRYLEVLLLVARLIVGMIVGLIIRVSPGMMIQSMVSFKYSIFFNFLLPPIILNSGYELHQVYSQQH
jgi:sodium/hydrogen exchanger-like protein 6/7